MNETPPSSSTDDYREIFYAKYVSAFKRTSGNKDDRCFRARKLTGLLRPILVSLERDRACIDIGCGDGALLAALGDLGFSRVCGVDRSTEQVEVGKLSGRDIRRGDGVQFLRGFADGSVGLVVMYDVIEHLTKREILEIMSQIARVLAPRGMLLVHTPNGAAPHFGDVYYGDFTHETLLNPASAENLCAVFGFDRFQAFENPGTSAGVKGTIRLCLWRGLRLCWRIVRLIETGAAGQPVLTRTFLFAGRKS